MADAGNDLYLAIAELAHHINAQVLRGDAQLLVAVRAFRIERIGADARIRYVQPETTPAELAGHVVAGVLPVDPELALAVRARDEVPADFDICHAGILLAETPRLAAADAPALIPKPQRLVRLASGTNLLG